MKFSRKLSDVLWAMAEQYLASLPEEMRSQILNDAKNTCSPSITEQTTSDTNS